MLGPESRNRARLGGTVGSTDSTVNRRFEPVDELTTASYRSSTAIDTTKITMVVSGPLATPGDENDRVTRV